MKKDRVKFIFAVALIGAMGSMIGWYWDIFIDCLANDITHVHFGAALLWVVLATLVIKSLNHLIYRD